MRIINRRRITGCKIKVSRVTMLSCDTKTFRCRTFVLDLNENKSMPICTIAYVIEYLKKLEFNRVFNGSKSRGHPFFVCLHNYILSADEEFLRGRMQKMTGIPGGRERVGHPWRGEPSHDKPRDRTYRRDHAGGANASLQIVIFFV